MPRAAGAVRRQRLRATWCARRAAAAARRAPGEGAGGRAGEEEEGGAGGEAAQSSEPGGSRRRLGPAMIKAILIFNNHGKPRLSKFYQRYVRAGWGLVAEAGPGGGRGARPPETEGFAAAQPPRFPQHRRFWCVAEGGGFARRY